MSVEQISLSSPPEQQRPLHEEISVDGLKKQYGVDVSGLCQGVSESIRDKFLQEINSYLVVLSHQDNSSQKVSHIADFVQVLSWYLWFSGDDIALHLPSLPQWLSGYRFKDSVGNDELIVYLDNFFLFQGKQEEATVEQKEATVEKWKVRVEQQEVIVDQQEVTVGDKIIIENREKLWLAKEQEKILTLMSELRSDSKIDTFFSSLNRDEKFKDFVESSRPFFKDVPFTDRLSFERYMQLVYFLDQVELWEVTIIDEKVREQIWGLDRLLVGVERRMGIVRPRLTYESIEYVEGADSGSLATIGQPEVFSMVQVPSWANIFEHVEDTYQDEIFGDESEYLQSLWVEEVEMLDLYPPIIKVWVDGERQGTLWMTMGGVLVDFWEGKYRVGV